MKNLNIRIFFALFTATTMQLPLFTAIVGDPIQAESSPGTIVNPNDPIATLPIDQTINPIPDPNLVMVDPEMDNSTETPIEEKINEQIAYTTCSITAEKPIAIVTPPIPIPGSEFRKMINHKRISYTIINAFLKENMPKNFTGTIQSKNITTQIQALAEKDKLLLIKKFMKKKIKNNALSAIQKEMYKNKKILSTLSLFAENMPFPNKQHLEILIQAFPTNPAPNVRMTPTFYLIIIGDSRQEMQNNN